MFSAFSASLIYLWLFPVTGSLCRHVFPTWLRAPYGGTLSVSFPILTNLRLCYLSHVLSKSLTAFTSLFCFYFNAFSIFYSKYPHTREMTGSYGESDIPYIALASYRLTCLGPSELLEVFVLIGGPHRNP